MNVWEAIWCTGNRGPGASGSECRTDGEGRENVYNTTSDLFLVQKFHGLDGTQSVLLDMNGYL